MRASAPSLHNYIASSDAMIFRYFLSLFSKILMSVKRILIFVAWEHVVIMKMECTMSVNVKMEP